MPFFFNWKHADRGTYVCLISCHLSNQVIFAFLLFVYTLEALENPKLLRSHHVTAVKASFFRTELERSCPPLTSLAMRFRASSSAVARSFLVDRLRPVPCVPMSASVSARDGSAVRFGAPELSREVNKSRYRGGKSASRGRSLSNIRSPPPP